MPELNIPPEMHVMIDQEEFRRRVQEIENTLVEAVAQVRQEEASEVPTDTPEPQTSRFHTNAVWIMPLPSRRGPGRVADINRYPRWAEVLRRVRAGYRLEAPQVMGPYGRPSYLTEHLGSHTTFWLGWHDNGQPMVAVELREGTNEEALVRRLIRTRMAATERRAQCHFCWTSFPVSDVRRLPVPEGRVAELRLADYGPIWACGSCAASWHNCNVRGCSHVGRSGDVTQRVVLDTAGNEGTICNEHLIDITRCPYCRMRFAGRQIMEPHNCINSVQPWSRCGLCGDYTRQYELITGSSGARFAVCNGPTTNCTTSLATCDGCGYRTLSRGMITVAADSSISAGHRLCSTCSTQHSFSQCEHCNHRYPAVDDHDCAPDGCRCDTCRPSRVIRSYSYKPLPRFRGQDRHGLFLGMELEIFVDGSHSPENVAHEVQDRMGRVGYIKSDGSIGHGFEIVTHPMSYEYAMERFPWDVLTLLDDRGSFVTEGAGIHVHASRDGFRGPRHEYAWMIFAHRNKAQFSALARRVSDQWASFTDEQRRMAKAIATKKERDHSRYRAINQTNSATVEVRIFMSTTDIQQAQATLGLVHASIEYARTIRARDAIKDKAWSWTSFVAWVRNAKIYGPLLAEMERLNVLDDGPVAPPAPQPRRRTAREIGEECCCNCYADGQDPCGGSCSCDLCAYCGYDNDPDH